MVSFRAMTTPADPPMVASPRRRLLASGVALALARPALAQGLPRLGVLMLPAEGDPDAAPRRTVLLEALAALGWRDRETIRIDLRWGGAQPEVLALAAREMLAQAPDVIVANGTPTVALLRSLTRSIPIVAAQVINPVGLGVAESLARPGGNVTGFTFISPELIAKWVSLLQEVAPGLRRVVLPYNPAFNPWYAGAVAEMARGPQPPGVEVVQTIIRSGDELLATLPQLAQVAGTGLILGPENVTLSRIGALAQMALALRLPGISVYAQFAAQGGLMSYGPDVLDIFRNAAGYVDRILRGASPATLPMQQPVRFNLALNLATAAALGLAIPPSLLAAADQVLD